MCSSGVLCAFSADCNGVFILGKVPDFYRRTGNTFKVSIVKTLHKEKGKRKKERKKRSTRL